MNKKPNDQNRITLSIAFIATYLTIILGFSEKIKTPSVGSGIIDDFVFGIFIFFGTLISIFFFCTLFLQL